jgi:hypothetical protein
VPAAQREQIRRLCCETRDHETPPHSSVSQRSIAISRSTPATTPIFAGPATYRRSQPEHSSRPTSHGRLLSAHHASWSASSRPAKTTSRLCGSGLPSSSPCSGRLPVKLDYRDILAVGLAWAERHCPPPRMACSVSHWLAQVD